MVLVDDLGGVNLHEDAAAIVGDGDALILFLLGDGNFGFFD